MKEAFENNKKNIKTVDSYDTYMKWKGWGQGTPVPAWLKDYFAGEVKRAGITAGAHLLEVGFGNGEFLKWARDAGYKIEGVEILEELVDQASLHDQKAYLLNLAEKLPANHPFQNKFDALLALDVLEHLDVDASIQLLKNAAQLTKVGGYFVLRFPNGGSPFGNIPQNGDFTHRQVLTEGKLRQLCCATAWDVRRFDNAFRVSNKNKWFGLKRLTFPIRDLLEIFLSYLYHGNRLPMDPVVTAVLVRK